MNLIIVGKMVQLSFSMAPKWSLGGSKSSFGSSKCSRWSQVDPRGCPGARRGGQGEPSWSQEEPQGAPGEPQRVPREPKMIQDEPKGGPKGAQREPKGLEMGQGGGSRGSKIRKVYISKSLKNQWFL